ncbi:MAG: BamA/TamA family outer membrane protein [Chlorobi bacterium]|nr:BamA/TamA family outer membrane protein [Chlorobiota bacterium]
MNLARYIFKYKISTLLKLFISSFLLLNYACKSTRYVPKGKYLLNKVKIETIGQEINKDELYTYIQQKPNRKTFFVFKFHLAVYNIINGGKERKIKNWIKNVIGEEPVIFDEYLENKTKKQLELALKNKGYYNSEITDSIIYKQRKVNIEYFVKPNKPYTINLIYYEIQDSLLEPIILNDKENSLIKKTTLLNIDELQNERIRITNLLQNLGYYKFSKEYIYYEIDTINGNNKANVKIGIKPFVRKIGQNTFIPESHRKYFIKNINIYTDFDPKYSFDPKELLAVDFDTLKYKGFTFIYNHKLNIKPEILIQSIYFSNNTLYSKKDVDLSYEYLTALRVYKLVNITFSEELINQNIETNSGTLTAHIFLTPLKRQSLTFEVEGTNSSANFGGDNIGFASNLIYRNKNLFRGAELLDVSTTGAFGVQTIKINQSKETYQTYEYGIKTNLYIPKFLLPFHSTRFIKKYNPKTIIPLAINFQNRPAYKRNIANFGFGYYWKGSKYLNYIVKPFNLNYVKYSNLDTSLLDLNISYLYNAYIDQFIPFSNYSLIYNSRKEKDDKKYIYILSNIEFAGNVLNGIGSIANFQKSEDDNYTLLGSAFAQYFKYDIDFRYYLILSETNKLVYRNFVGFGLPYGNSKIIPSIKQFYSGGAYSIRAWQARSLGPGRINYETSGTKYPNQLGDIKFETNLEYRFKMFWIIEGALFVDIGNIWYQNNNNFPVEGRFILSQFYKDLAIGTGIGTRFDFSFFVFRADFGIQARNPSLPKGEQWVLNLSNFNITEDVVLNLAIGYPF